MCKIARGKLLHNIGTLPWHSVMTHTGGMEGEMEAQEGGGVYIYMYVCIYIYKTVADLHCCMAETNTTL